MRLKPLFWVVLFLLLIGAGSFYLHRMSKQGTGGSPSQGQTKASAGPGLELNFYSSSAKKDWINKMVEQFNASGAQVGGKYVTIKAYHIESGQSLDDMKAGKIKPDLWSPGDDSWIRLAQTYWRDVQQQEIIERYEPLVNIPLVIAMWEPMARVLGYPNVVGWRDIAALAADPRGWAAKGHPEWGKFRWGHAHPDANSGFLAVLSEVYAATGKTQGLSVDDLKDPRAVEFLRKVEGAVEHYGLSNSWIDDLMHKRGPAYLSCAVQYENTIIASNEKNKNLPFKLVALYPKEGNFWTQHPVAILKAPWVTPERAEAAALFVQYLLSARAQQEALAMGLRPIRQEIALGAPFDEDHGVRQQVDASKQFQVPEESVLKRVRDLWEDVKAPATIALVIDRSGSMAGSAMDNAKLGAADFIKHMRPRDKLLLFVFNQHVTPLAEACLVRDCGEQASLSVQGMFAEGNTSLHDSVDYAYKELLELKLLEPDRRYAVIVLSDGKDTSSTLTRQDFLDALPQAEQFDMPKIYTIAYGEQADKDLLSEIANRTNARLFTSSTEDIAKTYKELSANF